MKTCWRIVLCIMVIGAWVGFPKSAMATEKMLRIAVIQLEPYGILGDDGQASGILYEIGNRIAETAGFAYETTIVPFARAIRSIKTGDADVVIMFPNEKISQAAEESAQIYSYRNIVLGPAGTSYTSMEDLHGKVIGNVREANYDEALTADTAIEKFSINDYTQGLKMLLNGRFDGVVGPEIGLLYTAKQLGFSREQFGEPLVLNTRDGYLYFSKETFDPKVSAALQAAVESLKELGVFEEIHQRYIGE